MKFTMNSVTSILLAAAFTLDYGSLVLGQPGELMDPQTGLFYRDDPSVVWTAEVSPVRRGNGVFIAPNDDLLLTTSSDGSVRAIDRAGSHLWSYGVPSTDSGFLLSSRSGITFVKGSDGAFDYMIYSVIENAHLVEPTSRVIALNLSGEELWVSDQLVGVPSGTPVASGDGKYVFLTHNSEFEACGHFTVLDAVNDGIIFFSQKNETGPFSPPGIYHSPIEGHFAGGENNQNDVLVWSLQPKLDDQVVGDGAIFGFQFPIGFQREQADSLAYTPLGTDVRDFQTVTRPVFSNFGLSMYWGTSRSQFRAWLGQSGLNRFRFNRPKTAIVGFPRGEPAMQAVFAPPALSPDPQQPFIFGGTASTQFVRLNFDFSEELSVEASSLIQTEARVSPDSLFVYYVESNGKIHQAKFDDLKDSWVHDLGLPVEGEFALTSDGSMLYVANVSGTVFALRVADPPSLEPTDSPSRIPSDAPSDFPTMRPVAPTNTPTDPPTSLLLTTSPTTSAPTIALSAAPPMNGDLQGSGASYSGFMLVLTVVVATGSFLL